MSVASGTRKKSHQSRWDFFFPPSQIRDRHWALTALQGGNADRLSAAWWMSCSKTSSMYVEEGQKGFWCRKHLPRDVNRHTQRCYNHDKHTEYTSFLMFFIDLIESWGGCWHTTGLHLLDLHSQSIIVICGTGKITISSSWQQLWLHHALNCTYIHEAEYVAFMFSK